jgi:hypothetical protein
MARRLTNARRAGVRDEDARFSALRHLAVKATNFFVFVEPKKLKERVVRRPNKRVIILLHGLLDPRRGIRHSHEGVSHDQFVRNLSHNNLHPYEKNFGWKTIATN